MNYTRRFYHNQNTQGAAANALRRAYCVPTSWTPPAAKGVFDHRTNTITMIYAPTPGAGDPRAGMKRVVNSALRTQMYVQ